MLWHHYQRALRTVTEQPLGSARRKHKNNIKMNLREVSCDDRMWIVLAQYRLETGFVTSCAEPLSFTFEELVSFCLVLLFGYQNIK